MVRLPYLVVRLLYLGGKAAVPGSKAAVPGGKAAAVPVYLVVRLSTVDQQMTVHLSMAMAVMEKEEMRTKTA